MNSLQLSFSVAGQQIFQVEQDFTFRPIGRSSRDSATAIRFAQSGSLDCPIGVFTILGHDFDFVDDVALLDGDGVRVDIVGV